MAESAGGGGGGPPPFLEKTYEMVDDASTAPVVSWSPSGSSFVVWDPLALARDLLPKFFKHSNFSSFIRQLNTYGFRKVHPELWEFANPDFLPGQKHRLKNIHRRKPMFSHSAQPPPGQRSSSSGSDRQALEEEIARLKSEKDLLQLELQEHVQKKHEIDRLLRKLEERFAAIRDRQRRLVDYFSRTVYLGGQSDHCVRKRNLPITAFPESQQTASPCLLDCDSSGMTESIVRVESSLNHLENFLQQVCEASNDHAIIYEHESPIICQPPAVALRQESSPETDPNFTACVADEQSYADPLESPQREVIADMRSRISEIDVNSAPTPTEPNLAGERAMRGQNDVFWEQFLTENPSSSDAREAESQQHDLNGEVDGVCG